MVMAPLMAKTSLNFLSQAPCALYVFPSFGNHHMRVYHNWPCFFEGRTESHRVWPACPSPLSKQVWEPALKPQNLSVASAVHVPAVCPEHSALMQEPETLHPGAISHPAGGTVGQTRELGVNGPRAAPANEGWELGLQTTSQSSLVGLNPTCSLMHLLLISFPSHLTSPWPTKFPGVAPM